MQGRDAAERSLLSPVELRRPAGRVLSALFILLLVALALVGLFPLYWMYSSALKGSLEILRFPPRLLPDHASFGNYLRAWRELNYPLYFRNTVLLALGALLLQLTISTAAAYSLSRLKPAGGRVLLFLFLSTLMVPSMAYLIPQYLTVVRVPVLGVSLLDSWWGVWLPQAAGAFNIFILKNFFDDIPAELTDAAVIDGAGPLQVFVRIILALSRPVLAVVTIFTVIGAWKDFFWPYLVLTGKPSLQPIMVALYRLTTALTYPQPVNVQVAGMAIASTPPLVLFLLFQRQIIRGLNLSGIKG